MLALSLSVACFVQRHICVDYLSIWNEDLNPGNESAPAIDSQ
jgi:hypothetical protein